LAAITGGVKVGYSQRGEGAKPIDITIKMAKNGQWMGERLLATPVPAGGTKREGRNVEPRLYVAMVLGEAAQRWVHRLKHNLGTARMLLGNAVESTALSRVIETDPDLRNRLNAIDREIISGGETATKILKYLRNPKPFCQRCELSNLVAAIVESKARALQPGITVSFVRHPAPLPVSVDPDQIAELIDNLLSNAVQAVRGSGTITIATNLAGNLLNSSHVAAAELIVRDDGIGIAGDELNRIFEPGYSRSTGGTGIGLALVNDIVENHRGSVRVESKQGAGTCMIVHLPLMEDRQA